MIPKKIHYCWLSNDPLPEKLKSCIESWNRYLPDYEIVKWDLKRFPLDKSIWVKQAFESKKYAFAADYIRLYALATEGGIYLDSDVEVVKPYDDLLNLPYFVCKENSPEGIEASTIGVDLNCEWIKKCYEQYEDRSFINPDGSMNTQVLPVVIERIIRKFYNLVQVDAPSQVLNDADNVYLLPFDYFSPKNYITKNITLTSNTYSIHHFAGTWQPWWKKFLLFFWLRFKVVFPKLASLLKK